MSRVERMFGPREEWGMGNERERVEAGKAASALNRKANPSVSKADSSPERGAERTERKTVGAATGTVPAAELKKGGFAAGMEKGIRGFVSIRCGGCGKIANTCLREARTIFVCKDCGHPTALEAVRTMKVECPRCRFRGAYKTNREEKRIVMECLNCSEPVQLRRGQRRGNYVTVKET